jgi:N-acetyl-anhydromuramyl-L-alanine amidase AmpD
MARQNTKITEQGKNFISEIINKNGESLLTGNNGILPFSDDGSGNPIDKKWIVNAKFNGEELTINNLKDALIFWFEKWSNKYELDPNVLAAQAYVESGYKIWWYDTKTTKSGINGFTMSMVYSIIIENFSDVRPEMTINEQTDILLNLNAGKSSTSYQPTSGNENTKQIARSNRGILHQNIINHPEIMIKAQARYMRYLSNNCAKLASTSLFCYNRGTNYIANTYSRAIEKSKKNDTKPELNEGLNYVLKIFGVLGDTNNLIKASFNKKYKPKNYSFGYDDIFITNNNSDLNTYPNDNFDSFKANTAESEQYNIDSEVLDNLSIARDNRYKFIYFPEDQYVKTETKQKLQIVLHHTVSGGNEDVGGDVKWWRDKGERVATSFIISRTGNIFQLFNTDYWAYHLGLKGEYIQSLGTTKSNKFLNQRSIGIEIDSWGGLIRGTRPDGVSGWFPTVMDRDGDKQTAEPRDNENPIENVQLYPKGFRGFKAFEKYTNAQINAVRDLILSLKQKFTNIDLTYKPDMWDIQYDDDGLSIPSEINGAWGISKNAMNGVSGIWTHVSYRNDKSDCHPQPELIQMLRDLSK